MVWDGEFTLFTYLLACLPACLPDCFLRLMGGGGGCCCCCCVADEVVLVRRPALGIFMFATGSGIDRALGQSPPDGVVRMGGVNGSEDAVAMIMNGTGDVGMEDVEAAKSRRWVRKGLVS